MPTSEAGVGSSVRALENARISAESQHVIDSLEAHHGAMRRAVDSGKLDGAAVAELERTGWVIAEALAQWGLRFRGEQSGNLAPGFAAHQAPEGQGNSAQDGPDGDSQAPADLASD